MIKKVHGEWTLKLNNESEDEDKVEDDILTLDSESEKSDDAFSDK